MVGLNEAHRVYPEKIDIKEEKKEEIKKVKKEEKPKKEEKEQEEKVKVQKPFTIEEKIDITEFQKIIKK